MLRLREKGHGEAKFVVKIARPSPVLPTALFLILIVPFFGLLAWLSASDMTWEHGRRDIWQHAAALRALIENPFEPANPFVITDNGSRHFHPLWVGAAVMARPFGLDEWAILTVASYLSLVILGTGIFMFARSLHPSPWSPVVLFLCLMSTWFVPIQHTGFHSPSTLLYAAAYPATFMIGLSLILWALTLRALENATVAIWVFPLSAFMFATHQLGAVIGFVGAGCLALVWGQGTWRAANAVVVAMLSGIAITALWPYHNPIEIVLRPGNSDWAEGPDFYGDVYLTAALVPSLIGMLGLIKPKYRALGCALAAYLGIYLMGLTGFQLAGRFLMPITLVLQIGIAAYILDVIDAKHDQRGLKFLVGLLGAAVVCFHVLFPTDFGLGNVDDRLAGGNVYVAAQHLTDDIPDDQQVGAGPFIEWPVVATGQRVLSVPWPEPLIPDLAARQAATAALFAPDLPADDRIALARAHGVRSLIAIEALLPEAILTVLRDQAVATSTSGRLIRFDLY
jgi:hypothetical protein